MSLKKRVGLLLILILAVALAYLLLAPVPIAPAAWTPPVSPGLTGPYQQNTRLSPVQRLSLGDGHGPEDVALDAEGKIYAGFEDGRIVVLKPDGTEPRVFANTGGRPLGLIFDQQGNLIVADAIKGLLSVSKAGEVKVLATEAEGIKFNCLERSRCWCGRDDLLHGSFAQVSDDSARQRPARAPAQRSPDGTRSAVTKSHERFCEAFTLQTEWR